MKLSKNKFFAVGSDLKIPKEQVEAFWIKLEKLDENSESILFAQYLFYIGALIVISAMTWFMNLGWEWFGSGGVFLIALSYTIVFALVGALCWNKKGLRTPAGLLITIAVCMVPLTIYSLESYLNIWPKDYPGKYQDFYHTVKGSWIFIELGTILAGVLALRFFPFPFLTAPIYFAAWFLTQDLIPLIVREDATWEQKSWISLCLGLVMIATGFFVDRRNKQDYSFWAYLFGTLSFWGGLGCLVWDKSEFVLFIYLVINLIMICLSILLKRMVLVIFGAIGVFAYLSHLAYDIFKDSIGFPFVLSIIGLGVIYLGFLYQKNRDWIEKNLLEKLPPSIRNFFN